MFLIGVCCIRLIIKYSSLIKIRVGHNAKNGKTNDIFYLILFVALLSSILILIAEFFLRNFLLNSSTTIEILGILSGMTAFGGMLLPVVYALFGSRLSYHSLGLIYALIELVQSSSEVSSVTIIQLFPYIKTPPVLIPIIFLFCILAFSISLWLLKKRTK